jgi:hypothetical protein
MHPRVRRRKALAAQDRTQVLAVRVDCDGPGEPTHGGLIRTSVPTVTRTDPAVIGADYPRG